MWETLRRRELDFGETIRLSAKLYFRNLHWIALFTFLLSIIINYVVANALVRMVQINPYAWTESMGQSWLMLLPLMFVSIVYHFLMMMTITFIIWRAAQDQKVALGEIIQLFMKKIFSSLKIALMVVGVFLFWLIGPVVIVLMGYTQVATILVYLVIFPICYWTINYTFVQQALIIEEKTGRAALAYSHELVRGRWWKIFFYFVGVGLILMIPGIFIMAPLEISLSNTMVGALIVSGVEKTLQAFVWVVTTVVFINLNFTTRRKVTTPPDLTV